VNDFRASTHESEPVAFFGVTDSVVVKVKPGSRKGPLVEVGPDGELTIYVRERAADGKANDAVIRLLAEHLQLPRSRVELVSGMTSRIKRFRVRR
jgi:uncharacterized protein